MAREIEPPVFSPPWPRVGYRVVSLSIFLVSGKIMAFLWPLVHSSYTFHKAKEKYKEESFVKIIIVFSASSQAGVSSLKYSVQCTVYSTARYKV